MHATSTTSAPLRTIVLMMAAAACQPLTPKPPAPTPAPSVTSSTSDATLTPGTKGTTYSRIEELIEARAPGVQVVRTEGSFTLRVRGISSPQTSNEPLLVIDGMLVQGPLHRALESVNPSDVLRIEVLKDAASTSFYGMRGGSGVILITTRKK